MPWTYSQTECTLLDPNGNVVGTGYSGHDEGYNNHAAQDKRDVGPTPVGQYSIGASFRHPQAGRATMRLQPMPGTNTFGRDGFMIHGDSADHAQNPGPHNSISHGCIILSFDLRQAIDTSDDKVMVVTV